MKRILLVIVGVHAAAPHAVVVGVGDVGGVVGGGGDEGGVWLLSLMTSMCRDGGVVMVVMFLSNVARLVCHT